MILKPRLKMPNSQLSSLENSKEENTQLSMQRLILTQPYLRSSNSSTLMIRHVPLLMEQINTLPLLWSESLMRAQSPTQETGRLLLLSHGSQVHPFLLWLTSAKTTLNQSLDKRTQLYSCSQARATNHQNFTRPTLMLLTNWREISYSLLVEFLTVFNRD